MYVPDLSTIPFCICPFVVFRVCSYICTWHCFATTLSEGPTAMCVVCLSCVCVCVCGCVCVCVFVCVCMFDTAYVVLRLHSSAADLDEHVGVCTCMFVCVSVLSLPPSLCVYIIFPYSSPYLSLYPSLSL